MWGEKREGEGNQTPKEGVKISVSMGKNLL